MRVDAGTATYLEHIMTRHNVLYQLNIYTILISLLLLVGKLAILVVTDK